MLQTVIILIGKYQLKDDVLLVVKQRVFYTKTLPRDRSILVEFHFFFFMDDLISRFTILSILNPRILN